MPSATDIHVTINRMSICIPLARSRFVDSSFLVSFRRANVNMYRYLVSTCRYRRSKTLAVNEIRFVLSCFFVSSRLPASSDGASSSLATGGAREFDRKTSTRRNLIVDYLFSSFSFLPLLRFGFASLR